MPKDFIYHTVDDVVRIHGFVMYPHPEACDRGKLEGAVNRAKNRWIYECACFEDQAVTHILSIAQAQAFTDGNKRTALMAFRDFCRINSHRYIGDPKALAEKLEAVATPSSSAGESGEARSNAMREFREWLKPLIIQYEYPASRNDRHHKKGYRQAVIRKHN